MLRSFTLYLIDLPSELNHAGKQIKIGHAEFLRGNHDEAVLIISAGSAAGCHIRLHIKIEYLVITACIGTAINPHKSFYTEKFNSVFAGFCDFFKLRRNN